MVAIVMEGDSMFFRPGPPGPPNGVNVQVNGPESIAVIWLQEASSPIENWHVLCVNSVTGDVAINRYVPLCL